jgi:thymidylate synthase
LWRQTFLSSFTDKESTVVKYLPYAERKPDTQYRRIVKRIMGNGILMDENRQGVPSLTLIQETMKFDLRNGFPVIPDRDCSKFWDKGIGEICAFINGITDARELAEWGADWWLAWATGEKTELHGLPPFNIGPASYGGAFTAFPTLDGSLFDQFPNLVRQMKELPFDRVHAVTNWMPKENARGEGLGFQKNTIAPCHGDLNVFILGGRIHMHMKQRSADVPVGVPSNMIQYAALMLMLEHLTGYEAGGFYHTLVNAHVYVGGGVQDQSDKMRKLVRRTPGRFPTVKLNSKGKKVKDIRDFRREHFALTDYEPHLGMRIPVST